MISIIIECDSRHELLAQTLSPLVEGAVFGVVGEVILWSSGYDVILQDIADETGCIYLPECSLSKAIHKTRCDWLLFLLSGSVLQNHWIENVSAHMKFQNEPATFQRSKSNSLPFYKRAWKKSLKSELGLLIMRQQVLLKMTDPLTLQGLTKSLKSMPLKAEIITPPMKTKSHL